MSDAVKQAKERNDYRYAKLREVRRDLYDQCTATASALAFNHALSLRAAAAIEASLVALALQCIQEAPRECP